MDSGSGEGEGTGAKDDKETTTDADLLKRAWRNEKAAPEILQFESCLVERSREQIELMEENVEALVDEGEDPLTISLSQMDMDRTLFLLRSYLRTRLHKIEKFMFHIKRSDHLWSRLSSQEQDFANRSITDMTKHLEQSVLSKLPIRYSSHLQQSEISKEGDMVPEPKLDAYVVCRSREFLGALPVDEDGKGKPLDMYAGDIYALRYKSIKPLVESGQLDLV